MKGAQPSVLYLSHTGAVGGGAEVVLLQTMRAARTAGWRVYLVCPPGPLAERAAACADAVITLPLPSLGRTAHPARAMGQWLHWLYAAHRLTILITRLRPRLLHANSGVAALIACLPALVMRRPMVWQQHDIVPPRHVNRLLLGIVTGHIARRVIVPSRPVGQSLRALGVPDARIRVQYNCAVPRFFEPLPPRAACRDTLGLPHDVFTVGVVGRLVPNKGQRIVLDALAALRHRGLLVHGVLAGGVPENLDADVNRRYAASLHTRADLPDLAGHVSFLGFREDMRAVLGAIDILVMPSWNDPFPLAILEAFAAGVPVAASASGGHPEAIEDGITGLLFAPGDACALAGTLALLIDDSSLRARLAANARAKAEREYTEDVLPERIGRLYEEAETEVHYSSESGHGLTGPLALRAMDVARPKLSVLVPCFNNEDIIEECLRSVRWADEVVVCDSFSTDRTLQIAGRWADRILHHEYRNSASQKNWAIPQLAHDWVLIVDTDELVSSGLRKEIEMVLETCDVAGFRIPRANHLFGRRLRHGGAWPDYQIRLFRKDAGRYEPREVHAHVLLDGPSGTLAEPIMHYPHRSVGAMRRVLLGRYTSWEAIEKQRQGVRFRWHQLVLRPLGAFAYRYLYKEGFRDGLQGLFMAAVWAMYVFITYMKLRGLEREE